ncbi:multidrug transporter subunit MdtJ [Serratia ureilytica]|nr:multidrug transporter subunit MdtJ [Serratia ureilytica]MBH3022807.1 multidrug transporter subunit MdtJ [Serratia ureilytica]MBH3108686.1 multidrug transporter subunit MdtJ [Serratia ureilytica]MBH3176080.1 multidrug transporter subunit MdtJ [Serratia ureilytica]QQU62258.1 multidrug transporter subunit MdtJ [Serratia ureilytica]
MTGSNTRVLAWICLMVAIFFEVTGTSFMASAARDGGYVGYIIMATSLAFSYYFLALSIRKIGVGVAYAIWEGLGLALLTLVGVFIFKDNLSMRELIGLGIAVIGIVCVALGEEH